MKKIIMGVVACGLALSVNATIIGKPEQCPSLDRIKQGGIQHIIQDGYIWGGWTKSNYDTADEWLTIMTIGDAKNESQARQLSKSVLDGMEAIGDDDLKPNGPKEWTCMFFNATTGDIMMLESPPSAIEEAFGKLRARLRFRGK